MADHRKLITLKPGADPPHVSPYALYPPDGFRFETGDEIRERSRTELGQVKPAPPVSFTLTPRGFLFRVFHKAARHLRLLK